MKKLFLSLLSFCSLPFAFSQSSYWQQQVAYNIDVTLNDQAHSLKGFLELEYTNHSPDRLDFIWFHLWPNAYRDENTAFARQILRENDGKKRFESIKERGYIDSLDFRVGGSPVQTEALAAYTDIVKVVLPQPLQPGEKVTVTTPFFVKLPSYNSRSGHEGQSYMVCQWFPKPAVYDRKGWHPMPYLDQGEFYSEYGSFNVNITLPPAYIVGASGVLQNEAELKQYKAIGSSNLFAGGRKNATAYKAPSAPTKTLTFKGENIHDFAWFADKDFVLRYDTLQLSGGKVVDVFSYHHPKGNKNWVNSTDYIKSAVTSYSGWLGEYAYPVVAAVEGPKNVMSGGMEYPMITLITSPEADGEGLDAVITHEVGHNWFYGMLGSNEREHAWMDEGLNTYYQFRYEAEKYRGCEVFGPSLPKSVRQLPVPEFQAATFNALRQMPMEEAIDIPAGDFKNKDEYGLVTYIKTAIWMYRLEKALGREALEKGMQAYFRQWKFRHPYPEDLKAVLEKETGQDLSPYFEQLKAKGQL
ncbi:M1 family metallopeptidase [Paraflavisolibacter sp. H34]|uniref:M1 family metallopeptidase n=1 Tax=Huijunlia imazamoxiresistens TaxID=3127457 RepID=UPI0030185BB0